MSLAISVVMATYNRQMALERLLADLARQRLSPEAFEVIVVDDGSVPPAAERLEQTRVPYALKVLTQANAGPAAARHRGVLEASGEVIVFLDDDMRVDPGFLHAHLAEHHERGRAVVLGAIRPPRESGDMPLFERFHLDTLERIAETIRSGKTAVRGVNLCTGNVSLRREDYLNIGGFDMGLRESEDRDLGVRLEAAGIPLFMCDRASSTHATDHRDLIEWLDRSRRYGVSDLRIHLKNAGVMDANPWRFLFMVSRVSRPLLLAVAARPDWGRGMSRRIMAAAQALDHPPLTAVALKLTTLAYGVEYFGGLGMESGSLANALHGLSDQLKREPGATGETVLRATADLLDHVKADHAMSLAHRAHYHAGTVQRTTSRALVEQVGLQMLAWVRIMRWFKDVGFPDGARACSRLVRHLYGADIHWDARLSPGISIVHGMGLVISHAARVEPGCILFQNVTLGEGIHPETRTRGSPHLATNVHVGPGCTLLGPITVGSGTKIMAGSVLTQSVSENSLVTPAPASIGIRRSARVSTLPAGGEPPFAEVPSFHGAPHDRRSADNRTSTSMAMK